MNFQQTRKKGGFSKLNIELKEKTLAAIDAAAAKHGRERKAYVMMKLGVLDIEMSARQSAK